jgi:hypothetical protein
VVGGTDVGVDGAGIVGGMDVDVDGTGVLVVGSAFLQPTKRIRTIIHATAIL